MPFFALFCTLKIFQGLTNVAPTSYEMEFKKV